MDHSVNHETVVTLFEEQVKKTPKRMALVADDGKYSYQSLNEHVNQLAKYFKSQGIGPEKVVALHIDRSAQAIIVLMAVLKAGAAYLPLNKNDPVNRLQFMLTESDSDFLVCTARDYVIDQISTTIKLLSLDEIQDRISRQSISNLESIIKKNQLAVVMFTSGSTGNPKAVEVEHKSIENLVVSLTETLQVSPKSRFLQYSSLYFDVSYSEIWTTFISGASLYVPTDSLRTNPSAILSYMHINRISIAILPPALLSTFPKMFHSPLDILVVTGDTCPKSIMDTWHSQCRVINTYGPTEATVWATLAVYDGERNQWIGYPLPNVQCYVLDQEHQEVAVGEVGELHIGGVGLARGYRNQPKLTAEKFIWWQFNNESSARRIYKTGDRVKLLADRSLDFIGRADFQFKYNGVRIDPVEIETPLNQHPDVDHSLVTLKKSGDRQYLIVYVVSRKFKRLSGQMLREHLKRYLPANRIPNVFMFLKSFPLSSTGKIDRDALPLPKFDSVDGANITLNDTETSIRKIWAQVLSVDENQISPNTDFFSLGGCSLLASQLAAKLGVSHHLPVRLTDILDSPTLKSLAVKLHDIAKENKRLPLHQQNRPAAIPMSFAQKRLWLAYQAVQRQHPQAYNENISLRFSGNLNVDALCQALQALVDRHEALRTCFPRINEQAICEVKIDLEHQTLEQDLTSMIKLVADTDFGDLSKAPLMRVVLITIDENQHVLCLVFHHIIIDGISFPLLLQDFNALYNHFASGEKLTLPSLNVQYADYALWEQQLYASGYYEQACNYWKSQLKGVSGRMDLPLDNPRLSETTYAGSVYQFHTSEEITSGLKILAKVHEVSLFTVILSSIAILLFRYNQEEDFVLGVAHGERPDPILNESIGFFVNMLPIRIVQNPKLAVTQVLHQVHNNLLEAFQNNAPIETILDKLHLLQKVGSHPLFQVIVTMHNTPFFVMDLHDVDVSQFETVNISSAKFDLSFEIEPLRDGRLAFKIEYARDLFNEQTIKRIAKQWLALSACLIRSPGMAINKLSLLNQEQQQQKVNELIQKNYATVPENNMLALFDEQVQRWPDSIAIVESDTQMSYQELNDQANRLAHYLLEENNAPCANTCIAIVLNRSANFVISALAILKIGAAYLPLDPELPKLRLRFMLEDAAVEKVITDTDCLKKLPQTKTNVICLDHKNVENDLSLQLSRNPHTGVSPNHLAYVIYTSGSTGKPKGVMVEHRRVAHMVRTKTNIEVSHDDVVAHVCNVTFDASVFEIWGALLNGARLVIYPKSLLLNPLVFKESLITDQVNILLITTALLYRFLISDLTIFSSLKYVLFFGEKLMNTQILRELGKLKPEDRPQHVINGYGTTEDTVVSTTYTICFDKPIPDDLPIGMPIGGKQAYILNDKLQPVADGILGELYLGGAGLARGYLNQKKLTQQRFIDNPFLNDGSKLYRTGDLVRYRPSEGLVYIKRIDNQVKISGYRIELEGITKAILSQPYVNEAFVSHRMIDGRLTLVAFVSQRVSLLNTEDFKYVLRQNLSELLPHYMLPSVFVVIDTLPLNLNGKIDVNQLPVVSFQSQQEYIAATTPVEKELLELWQSVLSHQKKISIKDSFYSLGGSSLLAMQLTGMINEKFGHISYSDLFTQPTIESQAKLVKTPEEQRITPTLGIEFLKQEAMLDDDIRASHSWTENDYPVHPKNIFLTGATGFLGVFLLDELLKTTDANIFCLIRAQDQKHANERLAETLQKYRLTITEENLGRIYWVVGDVQRPRFGLSSAQYFEVASHIDIIYHCASNVNFVKPYATVKGVNVDGVKNILRLAINHGIKPVHYVSTASIFSYVHYFKRVTCLLEKEIVWDQVYEKVLPHDLGYVQSKAVAEKLVWQAKARGIPVAIHRSGFILCHSQTGVGSLGQLWAMLVKDCIAIGSYPRFLELREEYVTVDFVSQAIVRISQQADCVGKAYHLVPTHENNITTNTLFNTIQLAGLMLKAKSLRKWRLDIKEYIASGKPSALELLMPLFTDPVQDGLTLLEVYQASPEYAVGNTVAALEGSGIECPPMNQAILIRYIRYLLDKEWHSKAGYDKILPIQTEFCTD